MFKNIKTKSDFDSLSQKDKEIFKNILAGACVKQKEENNKIIDYYDFSILGDFEISEHDLNLPDLKTVDIDLSLKKAEEKQQKWNEYNTFANNLTVTVGNYKYAANKAALEEIARKTEAYKSNPQKSILWVEDWGQWTTTPIELEKVRLRAEEEKQNKIEELFGGES